ncbi:MAG TPA: YggS family pyridoxal phosphate-dependent enzyme [Pseudohongiella sp.]|nr:YggS family pyridoxal phosphate-dependent enzyme [Pseudohongiella sp.]
MSYSPENLTISDRYQQLLNDLREQELHYQRKAGSVNLVAVTKTHPAAVLREAWFAGMRDFGENYVQEALGKIRELSVSGSDTPGIVWHFIGPIQSNKTRDIAAHFDWVHSVDRLKIAQRLQEQRPVELPPLNVCVQINVSSEDTKSGTDLEQARELCAAVSNMDRLRLRGLMAIPAPCDDFEQQRAAFRPLAALFRELQQQYPTMDTLSMGMTNDYPAAIAEGSTMVRIGSALFGSRPPKQTT